MNAMLPGLRYFPGHLDLAVQTRLVDCLRSAVLEAPLFSPTMPRTGRPFSVRMTNLGQLGWVSDLSGYRYQATHPQSGRSWPPIPEELLAIWREVADYPHLPQACLVNFYGAGARMGLHRDADEQDLSAPVVSVSLGDTAIFRLGGLQRGGRTESLRLASGDVLVLGGAARLCYHGVDRIIPGSSTLLRDGGRLNLTLRRVTKA